MANPRIDDLRKKLEKEPGSRLFAQLAEELRKDGDLAEAIRIARQGLAQHPNYPSARMTLGRALVDSGDLAAARTEFETVLNGAPDNILASRYLAECLVGLGEEALALHRYRATLALAPGDKQVTARIQALENPSAPVAAGAGVAAPPDATPPPPVAEEEPAPIALVEVDGPMELVTRFEPPPPPPPTPAEDVFFEEPEAGPPPAVVPEKGEAPVPLVPVTEEEFELERPYEAPPVVVRPVVDSVGPTPRPETLAAEEAAVASEPVDAEPLEAEPIVAESLTEKAGVPEPASAEPEPVMLEPEVIDVEFDLEPPPAPGPPRVTFRDDVLKATGMATGDAPGTPAEPATALPALARPAAPAPPAAAPEPELASPTLAELYYEQGVPEKAVEVYRRLLERDPDNDRLRARLREIEAAGKRPAPPAGTPQEALDRAIARLEELRSALVRRD